jgi:DNA-binding CsgD family transcriptional regulator/tetratricopeptide (TPR) repeat protein
MIDSDKHAAAKVYASLTRREREILALLAQDLSDREIATRLVVAKSTVRWYNRQIFNKLGVDNRRQAAEQAAALGLLTHSKLVGEPKHNLPAPTAPFVGRIRELDELNRLISHPNTRLVTLLAPGGMGKTRLALAAADMLLRQFADGVYFLSLAPLTSSKHLVPAIAEACGFQFAPGSRTPHQQLLDFLRAKSMLLVLDNFEHLLEGAVLVSEILQAAPHVTVLITSRERLHLSSETVYPLGGLAQPEQADGEEVWTYPAVQLFIACALRAHPHFGSREADAVIRICRLVQGMPLAIELAAAWVGTLSPAEIADEIQRSADFLQTTMRDVPERLRSVRAVFEAAWGRLTEEERSVFCKLSVFRGGCTRDAARAVAGADVKTLSGLVNKALLWRNTESGRYDIHELLRQYGEERLQASEATYNATQNKHGEWFASYCEQQGEEMRGPQLNDALEAIEVDFHNVQRGWQWAARQQRHDLIWQYLFSTYYFAWLRNRLRDVEIDYRRITEELMARQGDAQHDALLGTLLGLLAWIQSVLGANDNSLESLQKSLSVFNRWDESTAHPIMVIALSWIGFLLRGQGDSAEGLRWCEKSIAVGRAHGYRFDLGLAFVIYGYSFANRGEMEAAEPLLKQAERIAGELRQPHLLGAVSHFWGIRQLAGGNYSEARVFFENILDIFRNLGDWWNLSGMLLQYSQILLHEQDYLTASQSLRELIVLMNNSGITQILAGVLLLYANLFIALGDRERAVEIGRFCLKRADTNMWGVEVAQVEQLQALLAQLETELSPDVYRAALQRGEQKTLQAVFKDLLS